MSRICQLTGKQGSTGNTRSHSLRSTRRTYRVNLVTKRINGKKMRIAASTLKTLTRKFLVA